jgi:AraC-like DNA-binding protein
MQITSTIFAINQRSYLPMKFDVINGFNSAAAVYGIIVGLILLVFPQKNAHSRRLLGMSVLAYSCVCLTMAFTYSHFILNAPHFFRIAAPLTYLIAPASYLYVRSAINDETRFKKWDWLHFIPFVFLLAELTPFYLRSSAWKIHVLNYYVTHREEMLYLREGFLEEHVHFIVRIVLTLGYVYLQFRLINNFWQRASVAVRARYETLINWLRLYSVLIVSTFSILLVISIINLYFRALGGTFNLIISFNLLITSLILIFKPSVLYSADTVSVTAQRDVNKAATALLKQNRVGEIKSAINNLLQNQHHYLNRGYSLSVMASELDVPAHLLSSVINSEYSMSFTDLINKCRIEYIINGFDEEKMEAYTFEGMAMEAGLNSRITFYRAVIKNTGRTPTIYFKKDR